MAALWKLPVIYVIENNKYGMGTSIERASARTDLYRRGEAYGIPGEQVDGMDVVAVHAAAEKAVAHARGGKGPYIFEMKTYRYRGHSMSDPGKYRSKEEVAKMREKHDPIEHLPKLLLTDGVADEATLKDIDRKIKEIVAAGDRVRADQPRARSGRAVDRHSRGSDCLRRACRPKRFLCRLKS